MSFYLSFFSFLSLLISLFVFVLCSFFKNKNRLKYTVHSLSLANLDFVPYWLKVLIRSFLVWFCLDFGPPIQKMLGLDR
jgi:hypothetical protein